MTKKARKELLPATGRYSAMAQAGNATHEVILSREYKDSANPDLEVPPEQRVKAYRACCAPLLLCAGRGCCPSGALAVEEERQRFREMLERPARSL